MLQRISECICARVPEIHDTFPRTLSFHKLLKLCLLHFLFYYFCYSTLLPPPRPLPSFQQNTHTHTLVHICLCIWYLWFKCVYIHVCLYIDTYICICICVCVCVCKLNLTSMCFPTLLILWFQQPPQQTTNTMPPTSLWALGISLFLIHDYTTPFFL